MAVFRIESRTIGAGGRVLYTTDANLADEAGGSFWFWHESTGTLAHRAVDGRLLGSAQTPFLSQLVAHRSGAVMVTLPIAPEEGVLYRVYAGDARFLREFNQFEERTRVVSAITFNDGLPYQNWKLIDDSGAPASLPIPPSVAGNIYSVRADARTICSQGIFLVYSVLNCHDRMTTAPTGLYQNFTSTLRHVGPAIVVDGNDAIEFYDRTGPLISELNRTDVVDDKLDAVFGVSAITSTGILHRTRIDGSE